MTNKAPAAALLQPSPSEIPPGVAIEAVFAAGVCAAGRIVVHEGLIVDEEPFGTRATAHRANCFYFAFYPQSLLAARREPYDQPWHAAYLPLPYSELHVMPIAGYGALLIQRESSSRMEEASLSADGIASLLRSVGDEAELKEALCDIAELAGAPRPAMNDLVIPVNRSVPPLLGVVDGLLGGDHSRR